MRMYQSSLNVNHYPLLSFAFIQGLVPRPQPGMLRTKYNSSNETFDIFIEEKYFGDFFVAWDTATNNDGRANNCPQSELMLWRVLTYIIENLVHDENGIKIDNVNVDGLEIYQ